MRAPEFFAHKWQLGLGPEGGGCGNPAPGPVGPEAGRLWQLLPRPHCSLHWVERCGWQPGAVSGLEAGGCAEAGTLAS